MWTQLRPKEEPVSASGRAKFTPGNTEIGPATTGGDKGTEVTVRVQSKTTFYSKSKQANHRPLPRTGSVEEDGERAL